MGNKWETTSSVASEETDDVAANVAIIAAGFVTAATLSVWPDLIVGLGIVAMNAGAAREVWLAAREEHRMAFLTVRRGKENSDREQLSCTVQNTLR